jgi:hypothetical protein
MQEVQRTGAIIILLIFLAFVWLQPKPVPTSSTIHDTAYIKKTDTLTKQKIKIQQKYDTLYMYFLDSPYSTRLLDSAININRQLDIKGVQ